MTVQNQAELSKYNAMTINADDKNDIEANNNDFLLGNKSEWSITPITYTINCCLNKRARPHIRPKIATRIIDFDLIYRQKMYKPSQ